MARASTFPFASHLYALLLVCFVSGSALAAPRAELWERWTRHDPGSRQQVDHGVWDALLARHVHPGPDGVARFAYAAVTPAERSALAGYSSELQSVSVSTLSRAEQRAFWINLYNAITVTVILEHYPVASIRDIDISPGLFSDGPWGAKLVRVEGEKLSLDDIEHRILRPIWKDPRIHYAVNCASIGCPDLMARAFTAANTEELLDEAARRFVNHPRGASVKDGRLVVSSIYEWFQEDFGGSDTGVIAHLRRFASPQLRAALRDVSVIADDRYDWTLNGVGG